MQFNFLEYDGRKRELIVPLSFKLASEFKDLTQSELVFIFFFADFRSLARYGEEKKRLEYAIKESGIEDPSPWLKSLCERYIQLQEAFIPQLNILNTTFNIVEKLKEHYRDADFGAVDGSGKLTGLAKEARDFAAKLPSLIDGLEKARESLEKNVRSTSARGNRKIGYYEDPKEDD